MFVQLLRWSRVNGLQRACMNRETRLFNAGEFVVFLENVRLELRLRDRKRKTVV